MTRTRKLAVQQRRRAELPHPPHRNHRQRRHHPAPPYAGLLAALRAGADAIADAQALAASPWGTGTLVLQILAAGGSTTCAPPPAVGDVGAVIAFAEAQLGKPYQWAAVGPDRYDCSGLTMAAYATIGVQLPHNAAMQSTHGTRVPSPRPTAPRRPGLLRQPRPPRRPLHRRRADDRRPAHRRRGPLRPPLVQLLRRRSARHPRPRPQRNAISQLAPAALGRAPRECAGTAGTDLSISCPSRPRQPTGAGSATRLCARSDPAPNRHPRLPLPSSG